MGFSIIVLILSLILSLILFNWLEISNVYYLSGVPSDVGTAMDRASMTNTFMQGVLGKELFNY